MTFNGWALEVGARFLSTRTFDLIVAPAVADCEFEHSSGRCASTRAVIGVLAALLGGAWEEARSGSGALTLLGLVSILASYFGFMFVLCVPKGVHVFASTQAAIVFAGIVLLFSFVPVVACCWPDRLPAQPAEDAR